MAPVQFRIDNALIITDVKLIIRLVVRINHTVTILGRIHDLLNKG